MVTVSNEDFTDFPLGAFPYDHEHSAMGEYHFYPEKGYKGNFFDPIADWEYKGPSWLVTSPLMDGTRCMESQRLVKIAPRKAVPVLRTGSVLWRDYTVTVRMRALINDAPSGFLFRYQTSLMHYGVYFVGDRVEIHRVEKEKRYILASVPFCWDADRFYTVSVTVSGDSFIVKVNGNAILSASDSRYKSGAVALSSCVPTQYALLKVEMEEKAYEAFKAELEENCKRTEKKRAALPQLRVLKKYDLGSFGGGRQLRFGHLTGTDELFFVIAQHQRRVYKDRYPFISCLTAVSFSSGKVLWQIGEPMDDEDQIMLTTDLPFQVYDIDGDGKDEVICSWNFKLMILEGETGKVRREADTPLNDQAPETVTGLEFGRYAFKRLSVDAIRIVNCTGKDRASDILVKDRYSRLWLFDCDFNLLWKYSKYNTGHFPYNYDFDGDGKDEIFSCYNMVDHDGAPVWSLPVDTDHTDEIVVGPFNPDWGTAIAIVSGWEGFMLVSLDGKILLKDVNGHGQRISVGSYYPGKKGQQICTTTYWGNNGIIYMHECDGTEIWHREMKSNGHVIAPVNWDGSGKDLILLQSDPVDGGIMDGEGDVVVPFPEDGHPRLSCEVLDIDSDGLDEIVVWDRKALWVYTRDRAVEKSEKAYDPEKYAPYNASNYRGEFSFPRWSSKQ